MGDEPAIFYLGVGMDANKDVVDAIRSQTEGIDGTIRIQTDYVVSVIRGLGDNIHGIGATNDLLRNIGKLLERIEQRLEKIEKNTGKGIIGELMR